MNALLMEEIVHKIVSTHPECSEYMLGNGECNSECDNDECNGDEGDCWVETTCNGTLCRDIWIGDGWFVIHLLHVDK